MANPAANINTIGQAFVRHYYTTFDQNRANIGGLYQASSMLSWEGTLTQGAAKIVEKLKALPFKKVAHKVNSVDCQPSGCGGIIVFCCGDLKIDDEVNAVKFSQVFHLMPAKAGTSNFWVHNDMFRLNYG